MEVKQAISPLWPSKEDEGAFQLTHMNDGRRWDCDHSLASHVLVQLIHLSRANLFSHHPPYLANSDYE
jgi:hypothetical protein